MPRENLTDKRVQALKSAPLGTRYKIMDGIVPGMGIRVTDKGKKTFVLVARFPSSTNPTRRALGRYGVLTLEQARVKARAWHVLLEKGQDPKDLVREQKAKEQRQRVSTFGAVAEEFIRLGLVGQPKAAIVARELRSEFVNDKMIDGQLRLGLNFRPLESITPHDVVRATDDAVARGAKYQAHNLLAHVRQMLNWAISRGIYGITTSPCDRMKPKQVIGHRALRSRVLTETEIMAFWRAASGRSADVAGRDHFASGSCHVVPCNHHRNKRHICCASQLVD